MSSTSTPVHLTRRGRALVVLSLAALLFAAFSYGRASTTSAVAADGPSTTQVVVQPGDTLWGLAEAAAPAADPREVIAEIRALNSLDGALQAGQVLVLPVAA